MPRSEKSLVKPESEFTPPDCAPGLSVPPRCLWGQDSTFPTLVSVSMWSTMLVLPYKHSTPGRQWRQQKSKKPFATGRKDSSTNNALLHLAFKEFLYTSKNSMKYICVGKHKNASISLCVSYVLGWRSLAETVLSSMKLTLVLTDLPEKMDPGLVFVTSQSPLASLTTVPNHSWKLG